MLYFDCPHCGNHLRLEDEFAGRDGWCRACKGMIVAPTPGRETPGLEALPLDVRYNRLSHLFRFAASKADNYKLLLARLRVQRDALTQELAKAVKENTRLATRLESLQSVVDAAADMSLATAGSPEHAVRDRQTLVDELTRERAHLRGQLEERDRELAALGEARDRDVQALQRDLARVQERLDAEGGKVADEILTLEAALIQARNEAAAATDRLRDAESAQRDLAAKAARVEEVEAELQHVTERQAEWEQARQDYEKLRQDYDALREDYAFLEKEYEALQEDLDMPSFGTLPEDGRGDLRSPMQPAPSDANGVDDRVIIPEVVMEEPDRPDPMVNALLRFLSKERDNDEVG